MDRLKFERAGEIEREIKDIESERSFIRKCLLDVDGRRLAGLKYVDGAIIDDFISSATNDLNAKIRALKAEFNSL